ncbi:MAG: hypothetical protein U1A24_11105 [Cypionkella sp.]|uniref:hypothetical protein n=1 Tax=Cypionkella sp. TaxID=2811411 RepID=UPI002AB810ED|nr:hypothetical protein [Cypionkella sp.]MDZ4311089.1 hypothetical protein [Cypionkella sp.]
MNTQAYRFVIGALAFCGSSFAAWANCVPPYATLFACDILDSDQRVEFCQSEPDANGIPDRYSYNFAAGAAMSELYFISDDNRFSTKYYRGGDASRETVGFGLPHEGYVYAFYITGVFGSSIQAAQLHVFDSLKAFESDKGEQEMLRLYCAPESVLVDWTFIGP